MGSTLKRRSLGFAFGLVGFSWAALIFLGPVALFLTWYGDCFSDACPSATRLDGAIYLLDVAAMIAVAIIALIAAVRPRRVWFAVIALIGLAFTAEAVAGLLGYRGLYAFGILLPAGILMTLGGVAGVGTLADRPPPGRLDSTEAAIGLGCTTFVLPLIVLLIASTVASGVDGTVLLVVAAILAILVVALLLRRRRVEPDHPFGGGGDFS